MKPYKLVGTILSVKGDCTAGHKVGEKIELTLWDPEKARRAPPLCVFFYNMIFPYLAVLQFGGELEENKDSFQMSCSDPINLVTIEVKRIKV